MPILPYPTGIEKGTEKWGSLETTTSYHVLLRCFSQSGTSLYQAPVCLGSPLTDSKQPRSLRPDPHSTRITSPAEQALDTIQMARNRSKGSVPSPPPNKLDPEEPGEQRRLLRRFPTDLVRANVPIPRHPVFDSPWDASSRQPSQLTSWKQRPS